MKCHIRPIRFEIRFEFESLLPIRFVFDSNANGRFALPRFQSSFALYLVSTVFLSDCFQLVNSNYLYLWTFKTNMSRREAEKVWERTRRQRWRKQTDETAWMIGYYCGIVTDARGRDIYAVSRRRALFSGVLHTGDNCCFCCFLCQLSSRH